MQLPNSSVPVFLQLGVGIVCSPSASWGLGESCYSDVPKEEAPTPYTLRTVGAGGCGLSVRLRTQTSLGTSGRAQGLGKGTAGTSSFPSSNTTVSCDLQQSWRNYPWVTRHALRLLVAGVDYGIQAKVSGRGRLGEGRAVCWAVALGKGEGSSRQSPHEHWHSENSKSRHQPGLCSPSLCVRVHRYPRGSAPCTRQDAREGEAAELRFCPTRQTWHGHGHGQGQLTCRARRACPERRCHAAPRTVGRRAGPNTLALPQALTCISPAGRVIY